MIHIKEENCPQNHNCPAVSSCPVDAISQKNQFSAPEIDEELCIDCGQCTNFCPVFQSAAF